MGDSQEIHGTALEVKERPRLGLVVVDDGLYTHRWVLPLVQNTQMNVVFIVPLRPFMSRNLNPGGAVGLWRVSWVRMRYYGVIATIKFAMKSFLSQCIAVLFRLGLVSTPHSIYSLAKSYSIPMFTPPLHDINHPGFCSQMASYQPGLILCAFSQKAKKSFLGAACLGCLNVHFSMLPQHRGREPLFWAMLEGKGAGVSVHWMTDRFDAGRVVYQKPLEISLFPTLHRAILAACDLASQVVPQAMDKALNWQEDHHGSSELPIANPWPTGKEIASFKQKGLRFN
jgi:folate-dependent phosphoribosylglycinamide formyltransferase PurN